MLTKDMKAKIEATPFEEMVAALVKPGAAIIASLSPGRANALHMAVGISGEAGELLDAIKKYVVYEKPLDRVNAVEELGDLEFYMEGLRAELGITRAETLAANKLKLLGKRYASGKYSNEQAVERADKAPVQGFYQGGPIMIRGDFGPELEGREQATVVSSDLTEAKIKALAQHIVANAAAGKAFL